jgi:RNA polymerase sigma-70 factor (ECF subfamily)
VHKDLEIVKKILAGDREAFDSLYDLYFPKVYNYVYIKLRSRTEAEDLVQDVFVAAIESLQSYEGRSSFLCWLYSITKNLLKNWFRTKYRNNAQLMDTEDDWYLNLHADSQTPLTQLEYREFLERWHANIENLPQENRMIFYLKHFNGMSLKEIALETDKSVGAVKTILYRTKNLLTKDLASLP